MQRIGEDEAEKLDYQLDLFAAEHRIRGKRVRKYCGTTTQIPVPPHIIDEALRKARQLVQAPGCQVP